MAKQLIGAMTSDWEPTKYQDQYQTALKMMIEEKIQNRPASAPALPSKKQMTGDIMEILRQSLLKTIETKKKPARSSPRTSTAGLV